MSKQFNEKEQQIISACQSNVWLTDWFEYPEYDYDYSFKEYDSPEELKNFFENGNWSIRTGAIFGDLAFVQQVNGGDEWLTLKTENGDFHGFESVSFGRMIESGGDVEFFDYLNRLQTQTVKQYWSEPSEQVQFQEKNVDAMEKLMECEKVCEKIYDCDYYADYNLSRADICVTEVSGREALQDFFLDNEETLGTVALCGDLMFVKEEATEDKWLALIKKDGNYESAYSYSMKEMAETSETFETTMDEIETFTHQMEEENLSENTSTDKISVLKIEVGKEPYVKEIGNDLKSLQKEVGGLIQVVLLEDDMEGPQMVINEEGKLLGLEMNRRIPHDIVCGDFFICMSDEEGDFTSLTPEKIQEYTEKFQEIPEFSDHEPDAQARTFIIGFDF